MNKQALLNRVLELMSDVTKARFEGALYAKLARAHGYADGYMRALIDAELVDRKELLKVIGDARKQVIEQQDESSETRIAAA